MIRQNQCPYVSKRIEAFLNLFNLHNPHDIKIWFLNVKDDKNRHELAALYIQAKVYQTASFKS
jgi:hypothetical protein